MELTILRSIILYQLIFLQAFCDPMESRPRFLASVEDMKTKQPNGKMESTNYKYIAIYQNVISGQFEIYHKETENGDNKIIMSIDIYNIPVMAGDNLVIEAIRSETSAILNLYCSISEGYAKNVFLAFRARINLVPFNLQEPAYTLQNVWGFENPDMTGRYKEMEPARLYIENIRPNNQNLRFVIKTLTEEKFLVFSSNYFGLIPYVVNNWVALVVAEELNNYELLHFYLLHFMNGFSDHFLNRVASDANPELSRILLNTISRGPQVGTLPPFPDDF